MNIENQTIQIELYIVGFSDFPDVRVPLYVIFLLIYLTTLCGNLLIMSLICYDSHLHTPMYFFITNLSFIDVIFTTVIFPKMLTNFFGKKSYVTLKECLVQLYFFIAMEGVEFFILTVMAFDRYSAICNPLRYTVIMNRALCGQLALGSFILGLIAAIPHTVMASALSFCKSHQINHFFCDMTALLKISCSSTQRIETLTYVIGAMFGMFSFFLILISYIYILYTIRKIQSAEGRSKGFSTCASHLIVVILFYGSLIFTYLRPPTMYSMNQNKLFSLLYCAAVPLFNPLIYSLKNKELRNALRKANRVNKKIRVNSLCTCSMVRKNETKQYGEKGDITLKDS